MAAVFQPARRRIQGVVDRRFNRRKYDAAKTIQAFSTRLREQVDLDALSAELLTMVDQTMQPTTAPYGCGHRREHRRVAEGKQLRHPIRHERLHAIPFRSRLSPHVRDGRPAYRPPWSDRDCLLITARARCLWHAGGTASENDMARTCRRRLPARGSGEARPGDDGLVGKLRSGAAASGRLRSRSVDPPAPLGGLTQR
jgi:hypothetical protein